MKGLRHSIRDGCRYDAGEHRQHDRDDEKMNDDRGKNDDHETNDDHDAKKSPPFTQIAELHHDRPHDAEQAATPVSRRSTPDR